MYTLGNTDFKFWRKARMKIYRGNSKAQSIYQLILFSRFYVPRTVSSHLKF